MLGTVFRIQGRLLNMEACTKIASKLREKEEYWSGKHSNKETNLFLIKTMPENEKKKKNLVEHYRLV